MEQINFDNRTTIYKWNSPQEFILAADQILNLQGSDHRSSWTGQTGSEIYRNTLHGDLSLVSEAESLLDKINASLEQNTRTWQASVNGAYPIVPEAIMGFPMAMRSRQPITSEFSPIRVIVDTTSSGGIGHADLIKRGTAILALVMKLTQQRPIDLFVVSALGSNHAGVNFVRLETRPLDISLACNALTSIGLARTAGYGYLERNAGSNGGWAWGIQPTGSGRSTYIERLRTTLDLVPNDLIIPPVFLGDPILRDPIKWINDVLDTFKIETN